MLNGLPPKDGKTYVAFLSNDEEPPTNVCVWWDTDELMWRYDSGLPMNIIDKKAMIGWDSINTSIVCDCPSEMTPGLPPKDSKTYIAWIDVTDFDSNEIEYHHLNVWWDSIEEYWRLDTNIPSKGSRLNEDCIHGWSYIKRNNVDFTPSQTNCLPLTDSPMDDVWDTELIPPEDYLSCKASAHQVRAALKTVKEYMSFLEDIGVVDMGSLGDEEDV